LHEEGFKTLDDFQGVDAVELANGESGCLISSV
jgi:hypothetical protein